MNGTKQKVLNLKIRSLLPLIVILFSVLSAFAGTTNPPVIIKITNFQIGTNLNNGKPAKTVEFKVVPPIQPTLLTLQSSTDLKEWKEEFNFKINTAPIGVTIFINEGATVMRVWRVIAYQ